MTDLLTRRAVVAGMGVLGLGMLAGCSPARGLEFKYGKNMSNEILGRSFKLKDTQGNVRTLSSYYGSMPMFFFGFTQCPMVCPTTLARAAQIKKLMGRDAGFLQVVFITLDPERDTPEQLKTYLDYFDAGFIGLTGPLDDIQTLANAAGVPFIPGDTSKENYTVDHGGNLALIGPDGQLRGFIRAPMRTQKLAEQLPMVLALE